MPPARSRPKPKVSQRQRQARVDNDLDVLLGSSPAIRAQESDSAASIHGFSPLSRKYGHQKGMTQPLLDAVEKMENFQVSGEEVRRFLREGGLRPRRH